MITDNEFLDWLQRDGEFRSLLAEVKYYSDNTESTEYMSNSGFVSSATDTPANTSYDDIIIEVPSFDIGLEVPDPVSGNMKISTKSSWGEIKVINEGGVRDGWLNRAWDGREIKLFLGSPSWNKSDFRTVLVGVVEDIEPSGSSEITFVLRGRDYLLDVPIQENLITSGGEKEKPIPLTFGTVFNIDAILIDEPLHIYKVHEFSIQDTIQVRDSGLAITVTKQNSAGTFTLSSQPSGRITCDVQGHNAGGFIQTASNIVKWILLNKTDLIIDDLDIDSFDSLNTECPQILGIHFEGANVSVIDAISDILSSVGAYWVFNRNGKVTVKRLIDPENGVSVATLGVDDIVENSFKAVQRSKPVQRVSVGYNRNYSVQKDGLAGAVTEQNRQNFGIEYKTVTTENAGILTKHPLSLVSDLIPTYIVNEADAQSETDRLAAIFNKNSTWFELEAFLIPFKINLGDIITLINPRYGFENGKKVMVVDISDNPLSSRSSLQVWALT